MADGDEGIAAPLADATEIAIPVIALGEFRYGIRGSRVQIRYEQWLIELLSGCRVLDVDSGTTVIYAGIREGLKRGGRPIPANDVWIAALARQHDMPVLSRDRHFDLVPKLMRVSW